MAIAPSQYRLHQLTKFMATGKTNFILLAQQIGARSSGEWTLSVAGGSVL